MDVAGLTGEGVADVVEICSTWDRTSRAASSIMVRIFAAASDGVTDIFVPATDGDMICFETPFDPQTGHSTNPRAAWSS